MSEGVEKTAGTPSEKQADGFGSMLYPRVFTMYILSTLAAILNYLR
jgi:hypothetical protein